MAQNQDSTQAQAQGQAQAPQAPQAPQPTVIPAEAAGGDQTLGETERLISGVGGGVLLLVGLLRRSLGGAVLALVGGGLVYRSVTGRRLLYQALDLRRAGPGPEDGLLVERSVTINRSPEELYRFWRNLENLPRFMKHLVSVRMIDARRSHWVAKAPAGQTVEWDAEIVSDTENELIAWRSVPGSQVHNEGAVRFRFLSPERGTEVQVVLKYDPPAGPLGVLIAKLFGEEPEQQVAEDLRRFKQVMETGEVSVADGVRKDRQEMRL